MSSIHKFYFLTCLTSFVCFPGMAQTAANPQEVQKSMEQSRSMLNKFSRKCERRTKMAERRFNRYERKIQRIRNSKIHSDSIQDETLNFKPQTSNFKPETGLGKEPLLDSLRLMNGFAEYSGIDNQKSIIDNQKSLDRAQQQLDVTQHTKSELLQRKEYWKAQANGDPKSGKWLGKMEKERYYYTAQIKEYRKPLRDPSNMDDKLMTALRSDSRFADFAATQPAEQQNPAKMQPRRMVQQLMKSQAAAIDADPTALLQSAKQKKSDLLGGLSDQANSFGNVDNAAQVPKFTPNPYKTKSFWQRMDFGFNLQFDNRTRFMPSTCVAGVQAAFNFNPKFSVGVLGNYRFGMGEINNIRFSHAGAGYGAFANYKVWKSLGVQAGYERNWRDGRNMRQPETLKSNPETLWNAWTSSALIGLTWEYGVGKKAKATAGIFFDALYRQHTPETNAVLWRMGWKI